MIIRYRMEMSFSIFSIGDRVRALNIFRYDIEESVCMRGHDTIEHPADMGVRGWGTDAREAFEEIAIAMFELMVETGGLEPLGSVSIACDGNGYEELLIEFLNTLLSRAHLEEMMFTGVRIDRMEQKGEKWTVEATARGVPRERVRDRLLTEVKAATYYGASVKRIESGVWEAQCVVDL